MFNLDTLLDAADPFIAEAIWGGLVVLLGPWLGRILWVMNVFYKEKKARDVLHQALESGVDMITDKLALAVEQGGAGAYEAGEATINEIVDYVQGSVPDALGTLKSATHSQLQRMARGKVNVRLSQLREMFR